jgi:hypothetical protein
VKAGGKQRNRFAEIPDYIGNRREMEDSKSVPVGSRTQPSEPTGDKFPEDRGDRVHLKRRLALNGLYGVIYQKIELFITTAVNTSNRFSFQRRHLLPFNSRRKDIKGTKVSTWLKFRTIF